jgi:hypothetical protein
MSSIMNTPDQSFSESRRIALLLADRAVHPLPETEAEELTALLTLHPEIDDTELDEAAAALQLAQPLLPESLPGHLRARLFAQAELYAGQLSKVVDLTAKLPIAAPKDREEVDAAAPAEIVPFPTASWQPRKPKTTEAPVFRPDWFGRLGWLAAAACLGIAFAGVREIRQLQKTLSTLQTTQAKVDYAARRQKLLALSDTTKPLVWTTTDYPGMPQVTGDVVWNEAQQEGYMRFVGLPVNDAQQLVYQLWIFAANQDEKYPVDGGVFNITAAGEVIVPIKANLQVRQPTLFALTMEKPGGVVVSKRDRLVLIAKVG